MPPPSASKVAFERCSTLDKAVAAAARDAGWLGGREPIVLLSPACASYDQFRNFEVRGEAFRALVAALPRARDLGVRNAATPIGRADRRRLGIWAMTLSRAERSRLADWWFTVDRVLLATVLVIAGTGMLLSLAASPAIALKRGLPTFYFVERHFLCAVAALATMGAVSLLTPAQIRRLGLATLCVSFALMILVLLTGLEINGARRWLHVGGYTLQPSEFAKPAFVLLSAWLFAEADRRPDMPATGAAVALFLLFAALLVLEPDLGQTLLVSLVWCALFFVGQPAAQMVRGVGGGAFGRACGGLFHLWPRALAHRSLPASRARRQLSDRTCAALFWRRRPVRQGAGRRHGQDRLTGRAYRLHLRRRRRRIRRTPLAS